MLNYHLFTITRRLTLFTLLIPMLSGCGWLTPTTVPGPPPTPIVAFETAAPAPTAASAPTAEPTALPGELPDWRDPAWQRLAGGDFNNDGIGDQVLYLPAEVAIRPGDAFVDEYLLNTGVAAEALLFMQPMGQEVAILMQIDRRAVTSDRPLFTFPSDAPPAAFLVALDPGGTYTVMLQPLSADGSLNSRFIGLNYYPELGSFGLTP